MRNIIRTQKPPKYIDFDSDVGAVYVYYKNRSTKVAETQSLSDYVNIDFDSKGELIGIEVIGISQISLKEIQNKVSRFIKIKDLDQAEITSNKSEKPIQV